MIITHTHSHKLLDLPPTGACHCQIVLSAWVMAGMGLTLSPPDYSPHRVNKILKPHMFESISMHQVKIQAAASSRRRFFKEIGTSQGLGFRVARYM